MPDDSRLEDSEGRPAQDSAPNNSWRVLIDHHACEGRQLCAEVCPTDVFEMQPTRLRHPLYWLKAKAHGGKQAFAVRESACIGCMECVKVCPEFAIAVTQRS